VLFDHQNLPLNKNYGVDPDRGKTIFGFCVGLPTTCLAAASAVYITDRIYALMREICGHMTAHRNASTAAK
jgi:hypothetical protein